MSSASELPAPGRRRFCTLVAGLLAAPGLAWSKQAGERVVFYAAVGRTLHLYHVDTSNLALAKVADGTTILPASIQYVWPHPSRKILYAAYSNRAGANPGDIHGVAALQVDGRTGRLQPLGAPLKLDNRPIHITVDHAGTHLLVASNAPSTLEVYALGPDGSPGALLDRKTGSDAGIYAHQVMVTPADRAVILVTRGNDASVTRPEDPGALKVFDFKDGRLLNAQSIAPGGGYGFGPRHVDFHPSRPWMYVSVERQNQLQVFDLQDGRPSAVPLFSKTTLSELANVRPAQVVGPVHVSRDGKFVYLANRSDGTVDFEGKKVYAGGENSIAVFRIDQQTGEPTLIQSIATRGFHARTFTLHPNGKMLVAASVAPMLVRQGAGITQVPAALSVFRINDDGRLAFARKVDIDTTAGPLFWCGMIALDG